MAPTLATKNACELLDADHIAVKHLFVEYARLASGPAPAQSGDSRVALAQTICNELTVHAQIEEEIFYPALQAALPDAAGLLGEAMAEHQEAKAMIAQIQALTTADAPMDALVAELNREIEHHVKQERDELFPRARSAPGLDLDALGQELRKRQQQIEAELSMPA